MRKNDFCVNDKVVGSCWGTVTTFEELDAKKKDDSLGEVKFIQILNEWNGKRRSEHDTKAGKKTRQNMPRKDKSDRQDINNGNHRQD